MAFELLYLFYKALLLEPLDIADVCVNTHCVQRSVSTDVMTFKHFNFYSETDVLSFPSFTFALLTYSQVYHPENYLRRMLHISSVNVDCHSIEATSNFECRCLYFTNSLRLQEMLGSLASPLCNYVYRKVSINIQFQLQIRQCTGGAIRWRS